MDIEFQVHYTPSGKDAIDVPLLGFTVSDTPPEKRWLSTSAGGAGGSSGGQNRPVFAIPPNEPNYAAPPAEAELAADAELVMFQPHMHLRGKDMTYAVEFPDGKQQVVLSVSKYDFTIMDNDCADSGRTGFTKMRIQQFLEKSNG